MISCLTPGPAVPTDHDLMSTMMSRITQLEAKVAFQAKDINEKVSFISVRLSAITVKQVDHIQQSCIQLILYKELVWSGKNQNDMTVNHILFTYIFFLCCLLLVVT